MKDVLEPVTVRLTLKVFPTASSQPLLSLGRKSSLEKRLLGED
jgi:hypothetical protein